MVSPITGNVGIRETPIPIEVNAYIPGRLDEFIKEMLAYNWLLTERVEFLKLVNE